MFGFLRKKLKKSVEKLSHKVEEVPKETEPKKPQKAPKTGLKKGMPETRREPKERPKPGFLERITRRELSKNDIDKFFEENESDFMQANIAVEVVDFLRQSLKEKLAGRPVKRMHASEFISQAFGEAIKEAVDQGKIDLRNLASDVGKKGKPLCMVFLGFNGSGKTTTIAKVAKYLLDAGHKPVLAAGDTFRAASIEQLEFHGEKLGIKTVKHSYGSDSAAVVFDAIKYAEANGCNIVLADTAGRMHTDRNLMDELKKVIRVNSPDLKVLVVDSLTGNDAVEQARQFNDAVGVDAVVMSKIDVNEKGGSILSVCYTIKKPILFLGTGQGYGDIEPFNPDKFVKDLLTD